MTFLFGGNMLQLPKMFGRRRESFANSLHSGPLSSLPSSAALRVVVDTPREIGEILGELIERETEHEQALDLRG